MHRGENSDPVPIELLLDILSRLPAKSIARFRCVSKLWCSLLHKPYFTELFFTRSSARPRFLIGIRKGHEWFFFSSPQPQNPYEKSSLVVAADFGTKISFDTVYYGICKYASGLLYLRNKQISKEEMMVICNPSTGQHAILPELRTSYRTGGGFLGFDPIGKQFKVLVINNFVHGEWVHHILTLGTETLRWRTIQPPFAYHKPLGNGICINGALYYISYFGDYHEYDYLLGIFDVRSEKFKFIRLDPYWRYSWPRELINYKGKLGVINFENIRFPLKLQMWVLEDVEKPEWSTYVYTLRPDEDEFVRDDGHISVVGMTALGEIVLAKQNACKPFYVFYFNPEKNTLLSVEIKGLREDKEKWSGQHQVYAFVDHVEDLKFDVMKTTYAATSISRQPEESISSTSYKEDHLQVRTVAHQQQDRPTFESVNKFDALRLLEDD